MGCDISGQIISFSEDMNDPVVITTEILNSRDYCFFGVLADMRCVEHKPVIAEKRGLPASVVPDSNDRSGAKFLRYFGDHSHSWATTDELREVARRYEIWGDNSQCCKNRDLPRLIRLTCDYAEAVVSYLFGKEKRKTLFVFGFDS